MEMRRPGLEPGTPAWKADMLTPTPMMLNKKGLINDNYVIINSSSIALFRTNFMCDSI